VGEAEAQFERRAIPAAMRWAGVALILSCALVRALAATDPFPYFGVDPMQFAEPLIGIGPKESLILDVLTMLGAGLVLLAEAARGGVMVWPLAAAGIACAGAMLHGFLLQRAWSLEDVRIGGVWMSGVLGAVAMMHACRDARVLRLVAAISIGAVMLFAARGFVQVVVEHQETVRQYQESKDAYIAAQGWAPGSASVRAFERRLSQPEATGWFGLSNVFASFAAAAMVTLAGWAALAIACRRRRTLPDGWMGLLLLGAAFAAAGLVLARSKGGFAAAGLGLAVLVAARMAGRLGGVREASMKRLGGWLAMALVAAALVGVVLRGIIGERIGELSLLFRWFYMQGAVGVFAAEPLTGVGPANFKEAYQVAKPPLSPEEVLSPHSVLLDFAATLGLFGVVLGWLWVWMVYRSGSWLLAGHPRDAVAGEQATPGQLRVDAWVCVLIPFAAVAFSTMLEQQALTPDMAVMRLLGLLMWAGVSIAAVAMMRVEPNWRWPLAAGVLVLAVHSQIEVTPVWHSSAPLAWVFVGMLAGGAAEALPRWRLRGAWGVAAALAVLAAAAAWSWRGLLPMATWQRVLAMAAQELHPVAEMRMRLMRLGQDPLDSPREVMIDLGSLTGRQPPRNAAEVDFAMHQLVATRTEVAAMQLGAALEVAPTHLPTVESLVRLHLSRAASLQALALPEGATKAAEAAAAAAEKLLSASPTAGAYNLMANVQISWFEFDQTAAHLEQAVAALEAADGLDPYGLSIPIRVMKLHLRLGNDEAARRWAGTVLDRDELQRLDPLRRLTDEERRQVELALTGP
jgi:hypothetical protein